MEALTVGYFTDDPAKGYGKAIRKAKDRSALLQAINLYAVAADDAQRCAEKMTDKDFADFRRDLPKVAKETSPEWAEEFTKRFGDIVMPAKMLIASLLADQFKAPWGTAFIRCQETGWSMLKNR